MFFIMIAQRAGQTLVCLLIAAMVGAEVQEHLSPECKQFLYMGTLPRGLEEQPFKKICQFYEGNPRFVTLYDTTNHIPIYSAYTFKRSDGFKKVDVPWMYEPQVGDEYWICLVFPSLCLILWGLSNCPQLQKQFKGPLIGAQMVKKGLISSV